MKKIKKLVLNKSVISNLNQPEMGQLMGGYGNSGTFCTLGCAGDTFYHCPGPYPLNTHEIPCASGYGCATW